MEEDASGERGGGEEGEREARVALFHYMSLSTVCPSWTDARVRRKTSWDDSADGTESPPSP